MLHPEQPSSIAELKRLQKSRSKSSGSELKSRSIELEAPKAVDAQQKSNISTANIFHIPARSTVQCQAQDAALDNFHRYQEMRQKRIEALLDDKENQDPGIEKSQDHGAEKQEGSPQHTEKGSERWYQLWHRLSKRQPARRSLAQIQPTVAPITDHQLAANQPRSGIFSSSDQRLLDWSIKKSIQINATSDIVRQLGFASPDQGTECQARVEFASNAPLSQATHPYLSCLYHWVYPPPNPTTPDHHPLYDLSLENIRLAKAEAHFAASSAMNSWQDALESLFSAFRARLCSYFYIIRADINVLFFHCLDGTPGVRIRILDDHRWIQDLESTSFWTEKNRDEMDPAPMAIIPDHNPQDQEDILEEMRELEQLSPGSTRIHKAGTLYVHQASARHEAEMKAAVPICFNGSSVVAQVYNWIHRAVSSLPTAIPVLISPTIFNRASLYKASVSTPKPVRRLVPLPSQSSVIQYREETRHRVLLQGIVLPLSSMIWIGEIYSRAGELTVELESDIHSIGFHDGKNSEIPAGHHIVHLNIQPQGIYHMTTHLFS